MPIQRALRQADVSISNPALKIVISKHGGDEMLPLMLDRIVRFAKKRWPERKRDLADGVG